jgi:predicted permease
VALSQNFPLGGGFLRSVFPEGKALDPDATVLTTTNPISPDYFRTLGVPLLRGRTFDTSDDAEGAWVAIINEAMADRFWPGEDALGQRFQFFADETDRHYQQPIEIVGIVRNKLINLGQPAQPIVYMPFKQWPGPGWSVNVRTSSDPATAMGAVQGLVRELEPNIPVNALTTMEENLAQQLWAPRMGAAMLSVFGLLALGLAMAGIYGVMANSVDQRVHEMGIRMALGAGRGQVVGLVVRQGMKLIGVGVVTGLVAALALSRLVENMLFEMRAFDPVTFGVVAGGLLVIALGAIYLPARRLTRLDPAIALRTD